MPSQTIQWFPGHMAKTRRMITENLSNVDIVLELLDARIPYSSRNPEIDRLCKGKPRLVLINKATLADPVMSDLWVKKYTSNNVRCILTDCQTGMGLSKIEPTVKELCADRLRKFEEKGMSGRNLKAMVLGIPNVGKSSLINRISKSKKAKVEDRPGVTKDKQWVETSIGINLLDMPGILWPKFEEERVGQNLALTGSIRDAILDSEELAVVLCDRLRELYPDKLLERYKLKNISREELSDMQAYEIFEAIGRARGFLISGGEVSYERTATMLLGEFRSGTIGKITLDRL